MKKSMLLCVGVLSALYCKATNVWKDVPVDLGTYEMPSSPNFYFMSGPYSVTLSADATISSLHTYGPVNKICYDFLSGRTLALGTCSTIGSDIDVVFQGGTWALGNGAFYAASETSNCGNIHEVWDGVTMACGFLGVSHYSYDTVVIITNGTTFTASKDIGIYRADSTKETIPATNCWFFVMGGSKLIGATTLSPIYTDYVYGGTHDVDSCWHVEVSGEGSEMSSAGYPISLCVGYQNRGITVRYSNMAAGTFTNKVDIGSLSAASDNALIVDSGACVTVADSITIGKTVGADRNRLEILDGATVDIGRYSVVNVGNESSCNSLMISNATFKGKGVVIGKGADSAYNTFRVYGTSTFNPLDGISPFFKGAGHHNRFIVDGGYSFGTYGSSDFKFVADTGKSVGNVVEIVGGATVDCDEFYLGTAKNVSAANDHDNLLFVGAGSTLNMADRILLRGNNDSLVVSNGVVNAYNIYAAYCAGSTGTVVRFVGPEARYSPRQNYFTFFGLGRDGEFVMDGTHMGSIDKSANFSDSWAGWSTNNMLKIVNGANFRASVLYMGYPYGGGRGDKGNKLFVGSGSTLDVNAIDVTGVNNKVIISNATVVCGAGSALVLGDVSSGTTIDVSGNELVFQGDSPRLMATNETRNAVVLRQNSTVRFELSGNGYTTTPMQATLDVGDGCSVAISISDDLRANLERSTSFQLTGRVILPSGLTEATFLNDLNAGLPAGCHAFLDNTGLWVRVKTSRERGLSIVFR